MSLFTLIGAVVVLKALYELVSFLAFHFHEPTVGRFLHGSAPYALITGATDGIGKATAKELYKRGFNLVLHGRNPDKLAKVQEELKQLGDRDVRVWVEDASRDGIDFDAAARQWDDIHLTLLVNNVGGAPPRGSTFDGVPQSDILSDLRKNLLFPFLLTHAVLPKLRKASVSGPVQVVFIGSFAGEAYIPHLVPYGPSKSFLKHMNGVLNADERVWNAPNVRVSMLYVIVGSVVSSSHKVHETLTDPSAESFAKAMVGKFGCGREIVAPWLMHAFSFWFVGMLPRVVSDKLFAASMVKEVELAKKL